MILSKDEVIQYFNNIKEKVPGHKYFIIIINSHLKALEKIEKLEREIYEEKQRAKQHNLFCHP